MTGPAARIEASALLRRPGVRSVLACLDRDGETARLVGGAVRNLLMGLPITDMDICTTALPDMVMARARAAGIHAVPTGYEHGTITLVVDGVPHEVTTLREDIGTDGRRAVVRFGRDFRADALRRDFTINALSLAADGGLYDYTGGLADIGPRRLRFIGDADQRIREDYLRILRFFRFSASYGTGALDPEGMAAVLRNRAGLEGLSRERVRQEMVKLLVAPHAEAVLAFMDVSGVLAGVLGGPADVSALAAMVAQEAAAGFGADAVRRLGALAVRNVGDISRLRADLRLTNREEAHLAAILPGVDGRADEAILKAALYRLGRAVFCDSVLFQAALLHDRSDRSAALSLPERWAVPHFLITGADVLALGIPKGPAVGRILAETEARWISAGMPEGREAQLGLVAAS